MQIQAGFLRCSDCFWLLDIDARHQPVKLSPGKISYLRFISWTSVRTMNSQSFIEHDDPIRFLQDCFNPVTFSTTEEIECMVDFHRELLLNDGTKTINGLSHICSSTDKVDCIDIRDIR